MINPDVDLFLSFFPWRDCRRYHNTCAFEVNEPHPGRTSPTWKDLVTNSMPADCEYLIKATYTDAVTVVAEYLLYCSDKQRYVPSISLDYLKFVLMKAKQPGAECPYPLILAQVFQAYYHFFQHDEMHQLFLRSFNLEQTNLEGLSGLFERVIVELREVVEELKALEAALEVKEEKEFLSKIVNGSLSALQLPLTPMSDDCDDAVFQLKLKNKRNNPWDPDSFTSSLPKRPRRKESSSVIAGPYYSLPDGRLPLLTQAVSMVLDDEFHFDPKMLPKLTISRVESNPSLDSIEGSGGAVQRRQKIKRKRFRLVFQDDSVVVSEPGYETFSSPAKQVPFDPQNIDENDPTIKKSGYLALKGIVAITSTRFRVQLNAFNHEKKKFSRNTQDLNEALWIFEVCLLISDSPPNLSQQLRIGNYNSLVLLPREFNYFQNPLEYLVELGRQILFFSYSDDVFPKYLLQIAIENFQNLEINVPIADEIRDKYATTITDQSVPSGSSSGSGATSSSSSSHSEGSFWSVILHLFKTGKTMKQCGFDFTKVFKRCPPALLPPKIFMSSEE